MAFSNLSLLLDIKHTLKLAFRNSFANDKPIPLLPPVIITNPSPYFSFKLFLDWIIYFLMKSKTIKIYLMIIITPIIEGIVEMQNILNK